MGSLKLYEWDVLKQLDNKPQTEIKNNSIAFIDGKIRYIIEVDKETGRISIYKTGSGLDNIVIESRGANKIIIK